MRHDYQDKEIIMLWFKKRNVLDKNKPVSSSNTFTVSKSANGKSPNGAVAKTTSTQRVLIERENELNKLKSLWHGAEEGHGGIALLAGEAGHGKSSLTAAFIAEIEAEDKPHKIARASCSAQTGRDEPFWPLADVMNQFVAAPTRTLAEDILDTVLDIVPSWVSIVPVAGDVVGAGLQTAKVVRERTKSSPGPNPDKLLREYLNALKTVAERQPVLIAVDDLHWSDAGSVRLLSHLSRNIADLPVMLLCAYRPSDVEVEGHPFKGLVAEIVRYNPDAELPLPPMSAAGVAALVNKQYPANKFPPSLADNLHQRTGGAPLFVLESLRLMQTRGDIQRDEADGKWMLRFSQRPQMMAIRAAALIGLGRLDEAKALLDQADEIASTSGIREWMAYVKFIHARYELAMKNYEMAVDMATEAARMLGEKWARFEEAQAIRIIAQAHKAAGNAPAAQHYYKQAIDVFKLIGNQAQVTATMQEARMN